MKPAGNLLLKVIQCYWILNICCTGIIAISICGCAPKVNEFNQTASRLEILEPSNWIGKELPILKYIDINETLRKGTWLVLLYHYDCPDCGRAIPMYEQMARDLEGNEDFLRIAFIAVPPYGLGPVSENSPCILGRLPETKEWFVTTPAVALLADGQVKAAWEEKAPNLDIILQKMAKDNKVDEKQKLFTLKTHFVRL